MRKEIKHPFQSHYDTLIKRVNNLTTTLKYDLNEFIDVLHLLESGQIELKKYKLYRIMYFEEWGGEDIQTARDYEKARINMGTLLKINIKNQNEL